MLCLILGINTLDESNNSQEAAEKAKKGGQ
jgi:hypothetical protein